MPSETPPTRTDETAGQPFPDWLRIVQAKVQAIAFGVVQIVVHDGRVTQIEVTEKTRLADRTLPRGAA